MAQNITQLYKDKLMEDLNLASLPQGEQDKAMEMIAARFQKVIIYTLLRALNEEQKQRFASMFSQPGQLEENVAELASEVPGLEQQVEQALTHEYEILKFAMNK
jgi:hypothetical protein